MHSAVVRAVATARDEQVDVVVLGGGVVGLCCAKSLLEAGLQVALVERADTPGCGVGGGATGAGQVSGLGFRCPPATLARTYIQIKHEGNKSTHTHIC